MYSIISGAATNPASISTQLRFNSVEDVLSRQEGGMNSFKTKLLTYL